MRGFEKKRWIGVFLFCLAGFLVLLLCLKSQREDSETYEYIKLSETETIQEEEYYVVYTSSTCASCIRLKQYIENIRDEYPQAETIKIYAVDVDEEELTKEMMTEFGVEGVPFILHYEKGEKKGMLYENIGEQDVIYFLGLAE